MTNTAINQELFDQAVSAMPADVLSKLRKTAAARFSESGFPTTRHEDWRYTNLSPAISLSNDWLASTDLSPHSPTTQALTIRSAIDAHWIPIHNGRFEFDDGSLPNGVSVSLLSDKSTASNFEMIAIDDPMAQLNAALLVDGLKISIAPGTVVEKPIGLLVDDYASGNAVVAQSRVLIDVQEGASAQFVEAQVSSGNGEHFANSVVQIDLKPNTKVDYLRIQQRARHHINTNNLNVELAEGATFNHCAFDFGGSLVRNDITARMHGRNSNVAMNGLYLAGDQQHIDNHTRVDHLVGPSNSDEDYRGILSGKSRCVFNGKAIVHRGADETDANQANHNLLLSKEAEIDTKPELEIYADEVKCSHGATVGQLDETALFYLRSRGLDVAEATRLITRAFASKVLSLLTVDAAHDYVAGAIDSRLDVLIGGDADE
jgi:Fe-S cluster assembly protein SufD